MSTLDKDYSPTGLKLEGQYENDRNGVSSKLFKDIIREVYGVSDVICGHHLIYEIRDKRPDGFTYDVVQEIPSADALIFDHEAAKKVWGEQKYRAVLHQLADEPIATRDQVLAKLYYSRSKDDNSTNGVEELTNALKAAEAAHAEYEKSLGHRDENWAEWYAKWMIGNSIRTATFW